MTARALVTGATGFIGRALCAELIENGWQVRAAVRCADRIEHVEQFATGELPLAEWSAALEGIDTVFHLAAAVHSRSADAVYRSVNVDGTERLAKAAARAGVRRFVFVSTIKVNGEATAAERPFRADDAPAPQDAYASSKWQAEQVLAAVAAGTGMEVVTLRPPLVYGAGVQANFLRLLQLVDTGFPLPFGSIRNRRSLVYVGNLVTLLRLCASHSSASGRTFLVADGEDMSTPGLVRRIAAALGREARLLPFPPFLLPTKVSGSLAVDAAGTFDDLAWRPPYSVAEGLSRTVAWYRSR